MKLEKNLLWLTCGLLLGACGNKVDDSVETAETSGAQTSGSEASTTLDSATTSATTGASTTTTTGSTSGDSSSGAEESTTAADDGTSSGGSTSDTGVGGHTVSGAVTRSVDPSQGNDAVGDIYLAVVDNCGMQFDVIAVGLVPDGDLSDPNASVPYAIDDVADGTWYLVAFLDDDADAQNTMQPDQGDLVVSDGMGIGCTEFTVAGADVQDVDIDLNFVLPF